MKVIAIVGSTGVGKTTVIKELIKKHNFKPIIETTCRPKRQGEQQGLQYNFISEQQFESEVEEGNLIGVSEFTISTNDVYKYGFSKHMLNNLKEGVYVIQANYQNLMFFKQFFGDNLIDIKLIRNKSAILESVKTRGDSIDEIINRISRDEIHYKYVKTHCTICNENISKTINTILCMVGD